MIVFKNVKVLFPYGIRDKVVVTENGAITEIADRFDAPERAEIIDGNGQYLSPGFIDAHVHGGGGFSAMSKNKSDIIAMAEAHLKFGTTSIVPTTLASPLKKLSEAVLAVKEAAAESKKANILGVHLEGPYLSLKYKGAQSADDLLDPLKEPPDALLSLWNGIRIMGAAPEREGCMELGEKLRSRGIVASIAHSAASYETAIEAKEHGYSDITHIYNACSSCYKENLFRKAGVVEAGLADDGFTTQAIGDLRHLPVGVLKLIYHCKGPEKMYLITDGLEFSASDVHENAVYTQENGVSVICEDGVMKLADRSALAGSKAVLKDCVWNLYHTVGVPLTDAVRMASLTPAEVLGFGKTKGQIKVGCDADLLLFDENMNLSFIMTNGRRVY